MDMTRGKPLSLLVRFALPLMAGNICQQLYTMVDTAIVGSGVGVEALASLGAADWLNWMILGIATGFTQGFSIMISQAFGAKDERKLNRAVAMSLILSVVLSLGTSILALLLLKPVLLLLNTPDNVIGGSIAYLRVMFSGLIVTMMYNLFSAILRSFGDSRTPLIAMVIGSLTNIVLDMLFVFQFSWGITGAAVATVIAQVLAALYCLKFVLKLPLIVWRKETFQFHFGVLKQLLRLGFPVAFQNIIISVGGLVVQYVVNGYGFIFIAGFTATNKLYGLLEFAAVSYGYAIATYCGQNLGAKKIQRIKQGVHTAVRLSLVTSFVISLVMIVGGKNILTLFVSSSAAEKAEVLLVAYRYLFIMAIFLSVLFLLHIYRSSLQGMGDTVIPMVSGIVELVMRVGVALLLPLVIGELGIFFAEIVAWFGAAVILMVSYYRKMRLFPNVPEDFEQTADSVEI